MSQRVLRKRTCEPDYEKTNIQRRKIDNKDEYDSSVLEFNEDSDSEDSEGEEYVESDDSEGDNSEGEDSEGDNSEGEDMDVYLEEYLEEFEECELEKGKLVNIISDNINERLKLQNDDIKQIFADNEDHNGIDVTMKITKIRFPTVRKCNYCNRQRLLTNKVTLNDKTFKMGPDCITRMELIKDVVDFLKIKKLTSEEIIEKIEAFENDIEENELMIKEKYVDKYEEYEEYE